MPSLLRETIEDSPFAIRRRSAISGVRAYAFRSFSFLAVNKGSDMLPGKNELMICCAHPAYQLHNELAARNLGIQSFQVQTRDELARRLPEADVLVVSGFWRNDLLQSAPRLKFIQSIGAGTDQFDRDLLRQSSVRLASAQGAMRGLCHSMRWL